MESLTRQSIEELDVPKIDTKIVEARRALFDLKLQKLTSGIEKPHLIRVLRKNIARLMTVRTIKTRNQ